MLSGISALLEALRALERDNGQAVLATVCLLYTSRCV